MFRERAHLVGAYSLGKAQRLIALIRNAGYDKPIFLHGAMEKITRYYADRGIALGRIELARTASKAELAGAVTLCPPTALEGSMVAALSDPVTCFAWLDARARGRASTWWNCHW